MIRPPFPVRGNVNSTICQTLPSKMDQAQADKMKEQIFSLLDEFERFGTLTLLLINDCFSYIPARNPPFTIQRVCQLCLSPDLYYKSVGKYLRAVERSLLVTSTWDLFPPLPPSEEEYAVNPASASSRSLRDSSTPLFSPIPFLHQDARSRSPSPLTIPSSQTAASSAQNSTPMLGLVDELDSPSPGHLSEKPTALSVTTVPSSVPPLNERFVRGETDPPEAATEERANEAKPGEEDEEVENMVLEHPEADT
jgi:serine/threonine-protein phosphatase 4 regulatory subunit 2